ncbi:hypothetical protein GCM10017687_29340 [Streptomyces echinatus]
MPAEAIVERIQMLAAQWVGPGSHDDVATVAISAPRAADLTVVGGQRSAGGTTYRRNG